MGSFTVSENNRILKEVSCKSLFILFNAAKEKNIDQQKLLEGIPYELSYLLEKKERIEWHVYCKLIDNLRPYFSIPEFEQMGRDFFKNDHYMEGYIFAFMFFSSGKFAKVIRKQLLKSGQSILKPMFACLTAQWELTGTNKARVEINLNPGYEHCPEWFYMSKGLWEHLGSQLGLKAIKIDLSITAAGGIYNVSWEKEGFFRRLKKRIRWLFDVQKVFVDLTESHDQLLNNYNKLEESKRLLQKQTTILKTAYNITRSIRQTRDINNTLIAITNALVHDAEFSSARIKLFRDIEGNNITAEAFTGISEKVTNPVKRDIIIDDQRKGEIIICPGNDMDINVTDELLNHLLPVVNITIHDSLVLRAITDYKDNLEKKVDERTNELKQAQEKLSEIINEQSRFFTNISHEFRTPLTLILGPSKQIMEQTQDGKVKWNADLIYSNACKLNKLAGQLLDISRIEAGRMKLETCRQNILPVIKRIFYSFKSFAERKSISLNFTAEREEIVIYFDEDKVDKIVSNILSNALKFTRAGGVVNVIVNIESVATAEINGEFVKISITDNGIGIPKDQLDKIFDRFYQVDNRASREYEGTGVGLSLTRELVEIHKGIIKVESEQGKGSTFSILFPFGRAHLSDQEIIEQHPERPGKITEDIYSPGYEHTANHGTGKNDLLKTNGDQEKPLVLIIEDNYDLRKYINEVLRDYYNTAGASNGKEGIEKAFDLIPDLIISDIMMPGMDGIKLCSSLKTDTRTSHVPVILLTAKATMQDKIEGLETGADDYIMKPFDSQELKARIKNLLEQRKRIQEHFQKYEIVLDENNLTSIDQKFLKNLVEAIIKNISDENFSVEILADHLAISRSLLHKKLTALTGESPNELIKRIRLNKAAKLIEYRSGNISEIALQVGFSNPSYFAECFYKQFGFKPSQYHNNTNKH